MATIKDKNITNGVEAVEKRKLFHTVGSSTN
jgi:hypothetical protein